MNISSVALYRTHPPATGHVDQLLPRYQQDVAIWGLFRSIPTCLLVKHLDEEDVEPIF